MGDNPDTRDQVKEVQILRCVGEAPPSAGGFHLYFRGERTRVIPHTATSAELKVLLEELPSLTEVIIDFTDTSPGARVCTAQGVAYNYVSIRFEQETGDVPALIPSRTNAAQRLKNVHATRADIRAARESTTDVV